MNTVEELRKTSFAGLPLKGKLQVKEMGPDQPSLMLQESISDGGEVCTRKFSTDWYARKEWLCGSATQNALFCFPCLLFGGDKAWTETGMGDLTDLADKTKKHEVSKTHLENCVKLSMLDPATMAVQVDDPLSLSVRKHNGEVENNRAILSKIIDCIRFCGAFELALCGNYETEDSENLGVLKGLVDFVASIDSVMQCHLPSAIMFGRPLKTIQNELLDCMLMVAKDHIKQQLKITPFVAIQVDDTRDVSSDCQNVLTFHYIDKYGSPVERFYGFTKLEDYRTETITAVLLQQLNEVLPEETDRQKLIAQSYDGASVMRGENGGVQKRIRDVFPNAHCIHSYAHQLHLVMQQAASQIKEVMVFFAGLSGFPEFFNGSAKRNEILEEVVKRRLPGSSCTRFNFNVQTASVVFKRRLELIECLEEIRAWPFDRSAVFQARLLLQLLEDGEFLYYLSLFHRITPHVDILGSQLQAAAFDSVAVRKAILDFVSAISSVRDSIRGLFAELPPHSELPSGQTKEALDQVASEACDLIIAHAQERFAFTGHLASATLVQASLFPAHNQTFPQQALDEAVETYTVLEEERLKTELSILYARRDFYRCKDASTLLRVLLGNNLEKALQQTVTLLRILVTTPMTAKAEQTSSALQKIKTFLQNTVSEERLDALAMLSIEKEMIKDIPDFNHRTIELFARQPEHQADFLYKE
ncbi:uncharacterized protein LOC128347007 [Hemicordylus capensis]|uniref:uncharacterized protein LOC128347007 n=1 Tax=Hemicordylus capensis TaxID=884348 RepID=UPI00230399CF|nr:uncharacterized protein LOC128347007 [Hemicordylus capensis]XP_053156923.1 uncharacterized protein LOC128347007 [Hemicordylus capensis]XP_053156924.1 uncharacterized protein LOC128347007 [Hemicordylus capensis]XP_053156925.1 uncharacterized protein LOC128347007 [Hemicordylus capensis]XP_053156926.1 uncharacterized protein LOC128347007 [Hemicordylus capensis]XP_053156927.1 uncharacterized protein LOC128347007 [Hemicordylus capensis]XP_053156928.1 uncharacterized protein LOC128347007 [Hemico